MPVFGRRVFSFGAAMLIERIEQEKLVLVVDLDGTLLRSDMLYESAWGGLGRDWRAPLHWAGALRDGRAALKRAMVAAHNVCVADLPYDAGVIAYIKAWRAEGARVVLATASDQRYADDVAAHLGLFDAAYGSDGVINLKGAQKAEFLEAQFGLHNFAYMGDSAADIAVWGRAKIAITVNASAGLRHQADTSAAQTEHLVTHSASVKPYLAAMRPHQWLKNLLVFLPMLAAHQFDLVTLTQTVLAFVCFSLIASSVYVVNDLLDLSADRAHPRKKNRPFAAGLIPIAHGTGMATGLLVAGAVIAAFLGAAFALVMLLYFAVTALYSLDFKRRIGIDIAVLSSLYTLRIIAGGAATGIDVSAWLIAFSVCIFLSLAALKRQAELVEHIARGLQVVNGRGYRAGHLDNVRRLAMLSGALSVAVLAFYINAPATLALYGQPFVLWATCPVILLWLWRMIAVTDRGGMHDDPVVYAARDRVSWVCFGAVAVIAIIAALT